MSSEAIKPYKNQHYESLKYQYSQYGYLFEDPEFPAIIKSLYYRQDESEDLSDIQWLRPRQVYNNPQFIVDGLHRKDIAQGAIGDCWFLSAVVGIAQKPRYFAKVVPQDQSFGYGYCGIFHFRFWQFGEWVDVVVDDRLPYTLDEDGNLKLMYCSNSEQPTEYWPALLEKAYAKLHGSYQALDGGEVYEGITDMSGGTHVEFDLPELEDEEHANFWPFLKKEFRKDTIIGCAIDGGREDEMDNGLITGHAYTVTKVLDLNGKKLIRIRNPWGQGEWTGAWSDNSEKWKSLTGAEMAKVNLKEAEDGEFWMSYSDFIKNWSTITVCHLSVNSYNEDIVDSEKSKDISYWSADYFHSKWIPGSNAGGSAETFWKNPQFLIQLSGKNGKEGTVIVSLLQKWSRLKRTLKKADENEYFEEEIQFKLFMVNEGVRVSDHKNTGLKFRSDQLEKIGTSGHHTALREVTKKFRITPGNYVVVPCTLEADVKCDFLARVFTHTMKIVGAELYKNNGYDFEYEGSEDEEDEEDDDYEEDDDDEEDYDEEDFEEDDDDEEEDEDEDEE